MHNITEEQAKALKGVTIDHDKMNSTEVQSFFCLNWNTTAAGLQMMHDLIKNPIVKIVVSMLIGIGNTIHGIVCKD